MPHRRPGWALPSGHIVRSQSEAALCEHLEAARLAHEHWTLSFEVPIGRTEWHLFVPSVLLTEVTCDDRTVVIEPILSVQAGGGLRRLQSFRRRYGRAFFVMVVARRAWHRRVPTDAYDALFDIEDLETLSAYVREKGKQDAGAARRARGRATGE